MNYYGLNVIISCVRVCSEKRLHNAKIQFFQIAKTIV